MGKWKNGQITAVLSYKQCKKSKKYQKKKKNIYQKIERKMYREYEF